MLTTKPAGMTQDQKKEKVNAAREYHSSLLSEYGAEPTDFNLKLQFFDKGSKVIGVFPSEFRNKNGFFMEYADSNLDFTDPKRTVYRLAPIDNYEDVYNILKSGSYAVPIEDLEEVKAKSYKPKQDFTVNFDTLTEVKDENISNMTITDFAAIMWMKPVSEKQWLNNLINQNI